MSLDKAISILTVMVPVIAYVITFVMVTKRNNEDIQGIKIEIKEVKFDIKALEKALDTRISTIASDVAVIKAICQERNVFGR